jgi:hypothetical protein
MEKVSHNKGILMLVKLGNNSIAPDYSDNISGVIKRGHRENSCGQ